MDQVSKVTNTIQATPPMLIQTGTALKWLKLRARTLSSSALITELVCGGFWRVSGYEKTAISTLDVSLNKVLPWKPKLMNFSP